MAQIENISDTARWVAVYRAMETERADAIFRDPFAARLAGDTRTGDRRHMKRGRSMAWAMIVRTAVFDEIILDRVRNGGVDTVLNLAAGLDARAVAHAAAADAALDRRRPAGHSRLQDRHADATRSPSAGTRRCASISPTPRSGRRCSRRSAPSRSAFWS